MTCFELGARCDGANRGYVVHQGAGRKEAVEGQVIKEQVVVGHAETGH